VEDGVTGATILLKDGKAFSSWCRTEDDAMALLMAAILLRTGRQDVAKLIGVAGQIDMGEIDEIVEENLDGEEENEGGWQ
jgi:hypothetical protein